jgi:uncharacterized protein YjdB
MKNIKRVIALVSIFTLLLSTISMADVSASDYKGHWAQSILESWIAKGYFSLSDGNIQPNKTITRAEFVSYVNKVYKFSDKADINFTDVKNSEAAYDDLAIAVKSGYIVGEPNGRFNPNNTITRGEVAVIMARLHNLSVKDRTTILASFKDKDTIADWCKDSAAATVNAGFMKGNGNYFNPKGLITKAELATLLDRSVKEYYKLVLDKSGTYDISNVNGNVLIDAPDVNLNGTQISGKLVISKNVGNGEIFLSNVNVKDTTFVNGGGANSIHFVNTTLSAVVVDKEGAQVRIVAEGTTRIDKVDIRSGAKLEDKTTANIGFNNVMVTGTLNGNETVVLSGEFTTVTLNAKDANVVIEKGKITELNILIKANIEILAGAVQDVIVSKEAEASKLGVFDGARIENIEINAKLQIAGNGDIITAQVNVSGVVSEIVIEVIKKVVSITVELVPVGTVGDVVLGNDSNPSTPPPPTTPTVPSTPTTPTTPYEPPSRPSDPPEDTRIPVTGVSLSHETASVEVGKSIQLSAIVSPSNATNKGLLWRSSDITIAVPDNNGLVKAYDTGTVTITVLSLENNAIVDRCVLTINPGIAPDFEGLQISRADYRANSFQIENAVPLQGTINYVVKTTSAQVERPAFKQNFRNIFITDDLIALDDLEYYSFEAEAGKFVQIYGLDSNNLLKQFYQIQLTSGMISIPAPAFNIPPTLEFGLRKDTVKINYTLPEGATSLWIWDLNYDEPNWPALGAKGIHSGPYTPGHEMHVSLNHYLILGACDDSGALLAFHYIHITPEHMYEGTPEEIALIELQDSIYALDTQAKIDAIEIKYSEVVALITAMPEGVLKTQFVGELEYVRRDIDFAQENFGIDAAVMAFNIAYRAAYNMSYSQESIDTAQTYKNAAAEKVNVMVAGTKKTELVQKLESIQTAINDYQNKINVTNVIEEYRLAQNTAAITLEMLQATGVTTILVENLEAYKVEISKLEVPLLYENLYGFFETVNEDIIALKAINNATLDNIESILEQYSSEYIINIYQEYSLLLDKSSIHLALIGKDFTNVDLVGVAFYGALNTAYSAQKDAITTNKVVELEAMIATGLINWSNIPMVSSKHNDALLLVYEITDDILKTDLMSRLAAVEDVINISEAEYYVSDAEALASILDLSNQGNISSVGYRISMANSAIYHAPEGDKKIELQQRIATIQSQVDTAQLQINTTKVDEVTKTITIENLIGSNVDANNVISNIVLPQGTSEVSVTWYSSNQDIINPTTGAVTRPVNFDTPVVLTVIVQRGTANKNINFTFTVLKQ